jgi:thiol-disulfide isomerase/thioredoxin
MSDPSTPPSRSGHLWLYIAAGFIVFWVMYLKFFAPGVPAASADFTWKLHDLEGQPVAFSTFKGKPIFLNVWATWCPPCVGELPSIAKLAADPKIAGVTVVCVATDDSVATVQEFVKRQDWPKTMTVLHASDMPRVFSTDGIPATFLIDRDGRIVASEVGAADWSVPTVVEFLQKLNRGQPGGAPRPGPLRPS